jgi:ribosomal protein S18 acetylase RimI-like enzyme
MYFSSHMMVRNQWDMEIARIYAVSSSIGKGVGSQLMTECLRAARERGKQLVWLGVWEKNERAIQFYTRWGFEKFGEHVFMLGNDAQTDFLMKKLLV